VEPSYAQLVRALFRKRARLDESFHARDGLRAMLRRASDDRRRQWDAIVEPDFDARIALG
jgi:hypothetical protein